jgi:hypothetical protein
MASVYTSSISLAVTGLAAISSGTLTKAVTAAGDSDVVSATQTIGVASEIIVIPAGIAAGAAGAVVIKNLDTVNFVSVGFNNPCVAGTETLKIEAGCSCLLTIPSGALYAIADTLPVLIQLWAVEV